MTPAPAERRALIGALACVGLFGAAMGLTLPLLSLTLKKQGLDDAEIGASAAAMSAGFLAAGVVLAPLLRWRGATRALRMSLALCLAAIAALAVWRDASLWLVARFLLGGAMFIVSVLLEATVNLMAGGARRGRMLGVFTMTNSLGYAVGALLLAATEAAGLPSFLAIIGLLAASLAPTACFRAAEGGGPTPGASLRSIGAFATREWSLTVTVAVFAFFETAMYLLIPLYSIERGASPAAASLALAEFVFGMALAQVPVGWLIDRTSIRVGALCCSAVALAACALLPAAFESPAGRAALLALAGGGAFGLYTVALTAAGERRDRGVTVSASASFGLVYSLGGVAGPAFCGAVMLWLGVDAAPQLLACAFMAPLLLFLRPDPRGATARPRASPDPAAAARIGSQD